MARDRKTMQQSGPYKYYAKATDGNYSYYFKGTYFKSDDFKNKIRAWYAENVDPVNAYNLVFEEISNVGTIQGLDESKFLEI